MDTTVLKMYQTFGYFQFPISNRNKSKGKKCSNTALCLPSLIFVVVTIADISVLFAFSKGHQPKIPEVWDEELGVMSSTFYAIIIIKAAVHIFTTVLIQLTIFLRRNKFAQFNVEFVNLIEEFFTFLDVAKSNCLIKTIPRMRKKYETRLHWELIIAGACWIACIYMWEGYVGNTNVGHETAGELFTNKL